MGFSRRSFLRNISAGALGASFTHFLPVSTSKVFAQSGGEPRHLLVIDCNGGLDTLMAFPFIGATEALINARRPTLALSAADRFILNGQIGIHKSMEALNTGAVGNLLANHSMFFTMAGVPGHNQLGHEGARKVMSVLSPNIQTAKDGWLGRAKEGLHPYGCFGIGSSGLTFAPNTALKSCLQLSNLESYKFNVRGFSPAEQNRFINASKSLLNAPKPAENPPLRQDVDQINSMLHDSLPLIEQIKQINIAETNFSENGANNHSAYLFKDAAKIAIGRDAAQVSTITYLQRGGFDHHDHQMQSLPELLKELSYALYGYLSEMISRSMQNRVTVLITTEFGRTTPSNGGGSDHGYAFTAAAIGGAVSGGAGKTVYGETPDAAAINQLYLPVSLDIRNVHFRIMQWMGVDPYTVITDPSFSLDNSLNIFA